MPASVHFDPTPFLLTLGITLASRSALRSSASWDGWNWKLVCSKAQNQEMLHHQTYICLDDNRVIHNVYHQNIKSNFDFRLWDFRTVCLKRILCHFQNGETRSVGLVTASLAARSASSWIFSILAWPKSWFFICPSYDNLRLKGNNFILLEYTVVYTPKSPKLSNLF